MQSLLPGKVASEGEDGRVIAGWFVPQPHVYARHAVSTLGISHRTTGYWLHTLQVRYRDYIFTMILSDDFCCYISCFVFFPAWAYAVCARLDMDAGSTADV